MQGYRLLNLLLATISRETRWTIFCISRRRPVRIGIPTHAEGRWGVVSFLVLCSTCHAIRIIPWRVLGP